MTQKVHHDCDPMQTRRSLLKLGSSGIALCALPVLSACSQLEDALFPNASSGAPNSSAPTAFSRPTPNNLKIGLMVPLSGPFAIEGDAQKKGFELAVQHLNGEGDGGMLSTMQPNALQANGVCGRPVEYVTIDTQSNNEIIDTAARRILTQDTVSMIVGASSSDASRIIGSICSLFDAVHMTSMALNNELTGRFRSSYLFRQNMNANIAGIALAEAMYRDLGAERSAYYLSESSSWGAESALAIQNASEQRGWRSVATKQTDRVLDSYSSYFEDFSDSEADVLILAYDGLELVKVLNQAREFGISEIQKNGKTVAVGIPAFTTLIAEAAGESCTGVYGSLNWHWSLQDAASVAFTASYESAYGTKPSEAAHTIYVQTLQYADAAERASSFQPCDVSAQLAGHTFSGTGNGLNEYRAEDHQCFKDTLVVTGRASPSSNFDLLEIRHTISKKDTEYSSSDESVYGILFGCADA